MVVEQEMAEVYPPSAEELGELLPETDCGDCGFGSCMDFASALLGGEAEARQCPHLTPEFTSTVDVVMALNKDPIPYNIMMEQCPCTLIEVHDPNEKSPLLLTGNFQETVRIVRGILESTRTKALLLPTFTHGYSVDNAVPERMFKALEVWKAMQENVIQEKLERPVLIVPGLAESERNAIRQMTRCEVLVGPVSGFLLPLFLLKYQEDLS